jgi:hypothetical protein
MMDDGNKMNNMKTTTTMMDEHNTKTGDMGGKMMGTKTTNMYENPMKGTSTSSDDSTPTYGSGYNKWNDGYNNCVQRMYSLSIYLYRSVASLYIARGRMHEQLWCTPVHVHASAFHNHVRR